MNELKQKIHDEANGLDYILAGDWKQETSDVIAIGAGIGLSTVASLTYSGERFGRYFFDFKEHFGINDM